MIYSLFPETNIVYGLNKSSCNKLCSDFNKTYPNGQTNLYNCGLPASCYYVNDNGVPSCTMLHN